MSTQPRPADFTGRQRAAATASAAEQRKKDDAKAYAAEVAEAEEKANTIVDVTGATPVVLPADEVVEAKAATVIDEVEAVGVEAPEAKFEVIQVLDDIEQMTFGRENYDFERGRKYKVPVEIANHLREKGYVLTY